MTHLPFPLPPSLLLPPSAPQIQEELELERAERDEVEATHEALQEYAEELELQHRSLRQVHEQEAKRTESELVRGACPVAAVPWCTRL